MSRQTERSEPTSAHDSLRRTAALAVLAGFALVLLSAAITVGPLLRSRLQSKGLSKRPTGSKRRGGIRYRE